MKPLGLLDIVPVCIEKAVSDYCAHLLNQTKEFFKILPTFKDDEALKVWNELVPLDKDKAKKIAEAIRYLNVILKINLMPDQKIKDQLAFMKNVLCQSNALIKIYHDFLQSHPCEVESFESEIIFLNLLAKKIPQLEISIKNIEAIESLGLPDALPVCIKKVVIDYYDCLANQTKEFKKEFFEILPAFKDAEALKVWKDLVNLNKDKAQGIAKVIVYLNVILKINSMPDQRIEDKLAFMKNVLCQINALIKTYQDFLQQHSFKIEHFESEIVFLKVLTAKKSHLENQAKTLENRIYKLNFRG